MIKYKTGRSEVSIDEVEIVRETDKCVFIDNGHRICREAKRSGWDNYFDTWEEAYEFLRAEAISKIIRVKTMLEEAQSTLQAVRDLRREHDTD